MPGRLIVWLLALAALIFIPLGFTAAEQAGAEESLVEAGLDRLNDRVRRDGCLTPEDHEELCRLLAETGGAYNISYMIGRRVEGSEGYFYEYEYSDSILETLEQDGSISLMQGDAFTVTASELSRGRAGRITACFSGGRDTLKEYSSGGICSSEEGGY